MWSEDKIKKYLKENLNEKRYIHSIMVSETAEKLASVYGADSSKARLSGLVHDSAKNLRNGDLINLAKLEGLEIDDVSLNTPQLLHGIAGAVIARETMGIEDEDIFNAVRYHTTGRINMSLLEKIIYISDYVEPSRSFPGVEALRELVSVNLDKALLKAFDVTIEFVISKGELLHKDTIEARNYLILNGLGLQN
jgi:predicted HD superfamily hydrolase involved in NAD metabolism